MLSYFLSATFLSSSLSSLMVVKCGLKIPWVTVQHHEACRTVIPIDGIFSSHRTTMINKEFIDLRKIICLRKFESLTFQN